MVIKPSISELEIISDNLVKSRFYSGAIKAESLIHTLTCSVEPSEIPELKESGLYNYLLDNCNITKSNNKIIFSIQ